MWCDSETVCGLPCALPVSFRLPVRIPSGHWSERDIDHASAADGGPALRQVVRWLPSTKSLPLLIVGVPRGSGGFPAFVTVTDISLVLPAVVVGKVSVLELKVAGGLITRTDSSTSTALPAPGVMVRVAVKALGIPRLSHPLRVRRHRTE